MLKNLVFLPALMTDARMYHTQIEALASLKLPIQVFVNQQYSNIQDFAKNVLQNTPANFSLIGTSMGGYVAMEMLRQEPARIQRVCLISTTYNEDSPAKKTERLGIIEELENTADQNFIGINQKVLASYVHEITPEKESLIKAMIQKLGRKTFIVQQKMILSRANYAKDFSNYPPALFIAANKDTLTPMELMAIMCTKAKGQLEVIENCGHLAPIDQPAKVATILKNWIVN